MSKLLKCFIASFLFGMFSIPLQSQNSPVALDLQRHVDLFTGDFNYNIPLLTVTGPNGESFPISMNYRSGIKVDQEASWVGLGWSLNLGEINRQTNGLPDDWKNGVYTKYKMNSLGAESTDENYRGYGPVWFKEYDYNYIVTTSMMDIFYNRSGFEFPDYDHFYVSGPGIGGKMRAYLFDYANLHQEPGEMSYTSTHAFTQDVQFRFINDPSVAKNEWLYYSTSRSFGILRDNARWRNNPDWQGNLHAWDEALPDPGWMNSNNYQFTGDINANQATKWEKRQKVYAANYIEYFTNQEIYDHYVSHEAPNTTNLIPGGFIDFKDFTAASSNRNNSAHYDLNGIGAYRITTPNGFVYHYSLPVYIREEEHTSCAFKDVSNIPKLEYVDYSRHEKTDKYAYTWKLIAITGPGYEDVNDNHFVDEGDKGYWIAINYEKWNKDNLPFIEKSPYYGYYLDKVYKELPTSIYDDPTYQLRGSKVKREKDIYYPNYIKTATQTLFFVKEIRNDAHSAETVNQDITPKLRLKELILLNNSDVATNSIFSTPSAISSTEFNNLSSLVNTNVMINSVDYANSKSTIDGLSQGRISFNFDYALAPGVYNNIDNSFALTPHKIHNTEVFEKTITLSSGNAGKLTLQDLYIYGYGGENIYGSKAAYEFTYPTASNDNPDYHHDYQDFFGNYKKHKDLTIFDRVGYCTDSDKGSLRAWSMTEIREPLGAELVLEYEADDYSETYLNTTGYNEFPTDPRRYFNFTCQGSDCSTLVFTDPNAIEFLNATDAIEVDLEVKYDCPSDNEFRNSRKTYGTSQLPFGSANGLYQYNLNNGIDFQSCQGEDLDGAEGSLMILLKKVYGGGVRVGKISITEPDKSERYGIDINYGVGVVGTENGRWENKYRYRFDVTPTLLQAERFAPSNVVGYKDVTVNVQAVEDASEIIQTPGGDDEKFGEIEYQFYTRSDFFIKEKYKAPRVFTNGQNGPTVAHFKEFQKMSLYTHGLYGKLKKRIIKNERGNNIQSTSYTYGPLMKNFVTKEMEEMKAGSSRIKEIFYKMGKDLSPPSGCNCDELWFEQAFAYEEWGHKLKSIRHKGLLENKLILFEDYDLYNGINAKVGEDDQLERVFAYENTASMGSKFLNKDNTNQINAVYKTSYPDYPERDNYIVSDKFYFVRELGTGGTYSSSTHNTDYWQGKDAYRSNDDANPSNWIRAHKPTLYNAAYKEMESIDRAGNYAAVQYDLANDKVTATAANSNYRSFVACGFEETVTEGSNTYFEGEVYNGQQQQASATGLEAHTGEYMAKVSGTGPYYSVKRDTRSEGLEVFEEGILPGRSYEASVWVHNNSPDLSVLEVDIDGKDGSQNTVNSLYTIQKNDSKNITIGDWTLMRIQFDIPEGFSTPNPTDDVTIQLKNNSGSGYSYFDDLRLQPIDAEVNASIFDEKRQLPEYILDNENFYTRLVYDAAGNVKETHREIETGEIKIQEITNHFAQ